MDNLENVRKDALIDGHIIEVKRGVHSARDLHAALLRLSYMLVKHPDMRGLLIIVDSRLTGERLNQEMGKMERVIRGDIINRMEVVRYTGKSFECFPVGLAENTVDRLLDLIREEKLTVKTKDSFYSLLQVLIVLWLRGAMPVTRTHLMEIAGMSYPTVAKALDRLSPYLSSTSDRSVDFEYFPRDEWKRLVAVSTKVRSTKRYAAPQGMSRPVEQLISRLKNLWTGQIGIGGVAGAESYYPNLDLIGLPRLDLSIHSWGIRRDLGFITQLDPALELLKDTKRPADVAVHAVNRKEALFIERNDGLSWADPVECLLDLYEAGLTAQADEFMKYLEKRRSGLI